MDTKKGLNFFFVIIAIITGGKLIRHFDFENLTFEKPALDVIYLVAFVASVFVLVKGLRKEPQK